MLHHAVTRQSVGTVDALLNDTKTASLINAVSNDGFTALMMAAEGGLEDIVRHLVYKIAAELDINKTSSEFRLTALMLAARKGHEDTVEILLLHPEIDVNLADFVGATALHTAAYMNHASICQMLVEREGIGLTKVSHHALNLILKFRNYGLRLMIPETMLCTTQSRGSPPRPYKLCLPTINAMTSSKL